MSLGLHSSDSEQPASEINVTPLVDVMLVLLVIFMVTAPMMDQGLQLELPKTKGASLEASTENQLVLKISKDRTIRINDTNIRVGDLKDKLASIYGNRKDRTLFVRADKDVPYGFVAYVIGEVRSAGISKLGLVTVPLDQQ